MSEEDEEYYDLVREIDAKVSSMTDWEIDFIGSLIDNDFKRFSPKQRENIDRIAEKL